MQDYVNLEIIKKRGSSINPDIHHSKVFSSECGYSDQIKFSYNLSKILTFSNWMEREFLNNIFNTVSVYRVTHNGRDFNAKFYGHSIDSQQLSASFLIRQIIKFIILKLIYIYHSCMPRPLAPDPISHVFVVYSEPIEIVSR